MMTIKDIILRTDFEAVAHEVKIHYGNEHIQKLNEVYIKLKKIPCKKNTGNMVIFIRALKENDRGDEDEVIQDFDNNDNSLMFDVCGEDNQYDGLYSIASADYEELLGYYIDSSTLVKFSNPQIVAHVIWEIQW